MKNKNVGRERATAQWTPITMGKIFTFPFSRLVHIRWTFRHNRKTQQWPILLSLIEMRFGKMSRFIVDIVRFECCVFCVRVGFDFDWIIWGANVFFLLEISFLLDVWVIIYLIVFISFRDFLYFSTYIEPSLCISSDMQWKSFNTKTLNVKK